jgi:hypothetical protein
MKTLRKTKKIESVNIVISHEVDRAVLFEDLLFSDKFKDSPYTKPNGKTTELKFLEDKGDYVTGLVVTTKESGLPPKRDRNEDTISELGFKDGEGLVYANVFIYDKALKVLMYEVNKNGTYLEEFVQYIYGFCNRTEPFGVFTISAPIVLRLNSYEEMLAMKYYSKIEFEITQPTQLIIENDAVEKIADVVKDLNGEYLKMDVGMQGRSMRGGLSTDIVQGMADFLHSLPIGKGKSVPTLKVSGLIQDPESEDKSFQHTLDLITEKYLADFKIEEQVNASSIQVIERKHSIKEVYLRCRADFKKIIAVEERYES